jgi:uncharacterized protein
MSGTVWINEFHYDNVGTDAGEFIEIAGLAGTDLTGWSLVLYNGNGGVTYSTTPLSGSIPSITGGYGVVSVSYPANGIQNGGAGASTTEGDAIALVNAGGTVVQFLAYEAAVTATNCVASGMTATLIPVAESGSDAVGGSLHLTGSGTAYADFTWALTSDDSPGAVNAGQSFGSLVTESLSINDVSLAEGNSGSSLLTFTVTRSGNLGAFAVDYATADGTATANSDYLATSGTLSFTAGGSLTQTVSVTINGDALAEANEGFTLNLSNLVNSAGTTTLADASGAGTITNDELSFTRIFEIQGGGHKAALVGGDLGTAGNSGATRVNVEGVVTAIAANGFYIQDATGDGNVNTSDGIFVFTNTSGTNFTAGQALAVGSTVQILGAQVSEFRPGAGQLTVTQLSITGSITGSSIVDLGGSATIAPVVLGVDRVMPTGSIASTGFTSFDPATHAADFWESLEGMLVQVTNPVAISPTNEFRTRDPANSANAEGPPNQEIWVTTGSAYDAASQTPRGGLIIAPGDFNPERIQLDDITPGIAMPDVDVGARLSTVTGVVNYDFGNYEVLVSAAPSVTTPSPLTPEVTSITRGPRQLTIGDYNAENLDAEIEDTSAALANTTGGVAGNDLYTRLGNSDDDIGDGLYAGHARNIALAMGAPLIVALQEVQDDDGGEISSVVSADRTLQTLVDLIETTYGVSYDFAYVSPANNTFGGQPNANIRNAFLYQSEFITLNGVSLLSDPNPGEADLFAGNDFAASRQPLVGNFSFNGVSFTIINNHLNSKGGDNALFGAVQPPVLTSEAQRTEQARIINDHVDSLLAADPDARIIIAGDLNDFGWSTPVQTIQGPPGAQVMFNLGEELLPANERYTYNFDGNTQQLDHQLVSASLLNNAAPVHDILQVNSEFAAQASDHDPSLSRFDFSAFGEVLAGTARPDLLDGQGGDDSVSGGTGNDTLIGGAGQDTLNGGRGQDSLVGGAGDDTYLVDSTADLITEAAGAGVDTVLAMIGRHSLAAHVENLTFTGIGRFTGNGNGLDNAITGAGGDDTLNGGAGADSLMGLGGNDRLNGGADADVLMGGAGNDVLDGGMGADELTGGLGNDVFRFIRGEANGDVITDFAGNGASAGDRMVFVGYGSKAAGASFTHAGGNLWQIASADGLTLDVIEITGAVVAQDWVFN